MPIRVLMVFRVFVLHVPSPDVDAGGHCGALDSVAFLMGLGSWAETT